MPTNLAIDDKLLNEAKEIGGHRTKKETVNEALKEYIQRRHQKEVLNMFGQVTYDEDYDYKQFRKNRS